MHTYRQNKALIEGRWEVVFDCGAQDYIPPVIKTYKYEADAARLVNYLNGGHEAYAVVQVLLERGS